MTLNYLWPAWALMNLAVFVAGLLLPLVTVNHLYFFENDIVLWTVPVLLADNGERALAAVVLLLGILFPIVKTLVYTVAPLKPRWAMLAGKFSPLAFFDVFMIALLVFVAKGAFASDAATASGTYALLIFACSSKLIDCAFARATSAA